MRPAIRDAKVERAFAALSDYERVLSMAQTDRPNEASAELTRIALVEALDEVADAGANVNEVQNTRLPSTILGGGDVQLPPGKHSTFLDRSAISDRSRDSLRKSITAIGDESTRQALEIVFEILTGKQP